MLLTTVHYTMGSIVLEISFYRSVSGLPLQEIQTHEEGVSSSMEVSEFITLIIPGKALRGGV